MKLIISMVKLGWTDGNLKKSWGEYPSLDSWVRNLYQDKLFPTREDFNKAYDARDPRLNRKGQEVLFTLKDLEQFESEISEGEFEEDYSALISKIKALFECEKIVFFY